MDITTLESKTILSDEWRKENNIPRPRPIKIITIEEDYFQTEDFFGNTRWWKIPE